MVDVQGLQVSKLCSCEVFGLLACLCGRTDRTEWTWWLAFRSRCTGLQPSWLSAIALVLTDVSFLELDFVTFQDAFKACDLVLAPISLSDDQSHLRLVLLH